MNYLDYDQIESLIDQIDNDFKKWTKVSSIGKSFEGRDIRVIEVNL